MGIKQTIEARRLLLADARKAAQVTCDMVARALADELNRTLRGA